MDEVLLEKHAGWAELILNRPASRNAIDGPLGIALAEHLEALNESPDIGAVLLRGAGGSFCSGLDLKQFNADPAPDWLADFQTIWRRAHKALYNLKPALVVAVDRYAINGAAALAFSADLLLMGESSFLQVGEVQQGMGAPYNMAWLRLRHSEALTAQVALIGERIDGVSAVKLGLACEAVADEKLQLRAQELLETLAQYPPGALAHIKAASGTYRREAADAWFDRAFAIGPAPSQKPRANEPA